MNRAEQLIAYLLDEAEFVDPKVAEIMSRAGTTERERLKSQEREAGLETEREMRATGWKPEEEGITTGTAVFGSHGKKARDYFRHPQRKQWPKMPEMKVGQVTKSDWPTRPAKPSLTIKGAKKYQPPHYAMPAPWKHWR